MGDVLNWGILGASNFALKQMGPAIHAAPNARLVALATSNAEKSIGFKAFCPDLNVHDSYEALLADADVDAVYIPLPNHLHVKWAQKAARAGKHVLVEKPIAMKAEEIDTLIALRDETGLLIAEAYMIVHHPQWLRARDLVQSGAIGQVDHVDTAFSYDNRADVNNVRNKPDMGGGGIRDIGVYTYSSVRFVTGAEPTDLSARIKTENGVDTWAQVVGEMAGPLGRFTYSAMTSMRLCPRQEVVFQGETGQIRLTAPFNAGIFGQAELELRRHDGTRTIENWPQANQYILQVENFGRTVRDGADYPCPLEFSRGTQAMIDRVFDVAVDIS
ncbi:Gfo/Idh/MocA family oxidoreductase [Aliiroseovarius sp. S1339]|uniref:Gfo/Idh/MocA family protein n=1 Tax=Aliiroseovarius sp. S1339 TaxID=2936990 RepID=UPI0020BD715E|nr:Gfo/Idh/MocA family oxidoreductase [Aliiroseovarius sp. S1339]MCK8463829.1 Gfo/Idh/MocA family oxidoreductase [Aliiroseovarius sp. S1339]